MEYFRAGCSDGVWTCSHVNNPMSDPRTLRVTVDNTDKYHDLLDNTALGDGLKKRSVRGGLFSMGGSGLNFALRFGSSIALARILLPEHFGLIGMVTAITAIAETFKDFGLSVATIQKKTITHLQVSTLFWINALVGLVMMAVICGLS